MKDYAERKSYVVSKEIFVSADDRLRNELTYDLMQYQTDILDRIQQTFTDHRDRCNDRFGRLEARRKIDTAASAGAGFLGGFVALVAKWIFNK